MGRRCYRIGLAKGADAAARTVVQRGKCKGDGGQQNGKAATVLLGLGRNGRVRTRPAIFPIRPATNLLYGLNEAIDMLHEEGLDNVFARHARHGAAARAAVRAWGLEVLCATQGQESGVLTAVKMPEGHSADAFRATTLGAL